MANTIELAAEPRTTLRKKVRFLRREGLVPGNVFGRGEPSAAIQVREREFEHLLSTYGRARVLSLRINGSEQAALISAVQRHPTRQSLLHIDFHRVSMTERVRVDVPLAVGGEAPAVRLYNGVLLHNLTNVSIEALPGDIPEKIDVDISSLTELDAAVYVRDLVAPPDVEIVADPDELIIKILPPTIERELAEEAAEAAAEAEAVEAAAEGEAPAAEGEAPAQAEASEGEKTEE